MDLHEFHDNWLGFCYQISFGNQTWKKVPTKVQLQPFFSELNRHVPAREGHDSGKLSALFIFFYWFSSHQSAILILSHVLSNYQPDGFVQKSGNCHKCTGSSSYALYHMHHETYIFEVYPFIYIPLYSI